MEDKDFELETDEDAYLCHGCIDEPYLKVEIKKDGKTKKCSFCNKKRKCTRLSDIAPKIEEVFKTNYKQGYEYYDPEDKYYEQAGDCIEWILQELLGTSEEIADSIVMNMPGSYYDPRDGEENPFEGNFIERFPDTFWVRESWGEFKETLKHKRRFFLNDFRDTLDSFFGNLKNHTTRDGRRLIRIIKPDNGNRQSSAKKWHSFYRARKVKDQKEIEDILKDPFKKLAAPPPVNATAGRMNPAGIPVFYGSENPKTCLKELRLTVGEMAVIGKFQIVKEVKLLDLPAYEQIYLDRSPFDPEYLDEAAQKAFLRSFHSEVSTPISEHDAPIDYLPTQVVAEYLAQELKLDGMIFRSAQGRKKDFNIVLFTHAIALADPEEIWEKAECHISQTDEGFDGFSISYRKKKKEGEGKRPKRDTSLPFDFDLNWESSIPKDTWIKLDLSSIQLFKVESVQIKSNSYECYCHEDWIENSDF